MFFAPTTHLALPFFDQAHRTLGSAVADWAPRQQVDESDDRRACRHWVRLLGDAGWLRYCVPAAFGGALEKLDSRSLVILRETLAFHSPLADFAFAMQGLGSGAITLAGGPAQQEHYLPAVARGDMIAAFALSEPEAGSDVGAMAMTARFEGSGNPASDTVVLEGSKTWISNGGIADYYCVFAKTEPALGRAMRTHDWTSTTPVVRNDTGLPVVYVQPRETLRKGMVSVTILHGLAAPGLVLGSAGASVPR